MTKKVEDLLNGPIKPVRIGTEVANCLKIEVGLVCDATSSMGPWLIRVKETLKDIVRNIESELEDSLEESQTFILRTSFVGYRDIKTKKSRFEIHPFTDDTDDIVNFIDKVEAFGGEDTCEDVQGGLKIMLQQDWSNNSAKKVFLICDAPGHGSDINGGCDDHYADGHPDGLKLKDLMAEYEDRGIDFMVMQLSSTCRHMVKEMKKHHCRFEKKVDWDEIESGF